MVYFDFYDLPFLDWILEGNFRIGLLLLLRSFNADNLQCFLDFVR